LELTTRRIVIEPDGIEIAARADETILQAARRAGHDLPHECGWGSCGVCKLTLVSGEVELIFPGAPAASPRDARRGRILVCQARATSDLIIRRNPGEWAGTPVRCVEHKATLKSVEELGPEIRRFSFETEAPAHFLPGQYAILHFGESLRRAYSMCNLPNGKLLQFIAKRYEGGSGSRAMASMRPGESLTIEAPFGVCTLNRKPGRKVFVAGGTGISPILSMIRQAAEEGIDFEEPVHVVYGARSPADLAAGDQLEQAARRIPRAHYAPVVESAPADWPHARGFVTDAVAAILSETSTAEFYVAGPPVMVNAVKALLARAEVPITQVHYDSFG
jgi:toluene monooxygenase electron transfer component